jgi:hypothetical protein
MNLPILTAELPQNQKVMLSFVLIQLHGIFSSAVVVLITVCVGIPLYILAMAKFLVRLHG